jgi:predicted enzyme related to lactoylglutathione lyase
MKQGIGLLVYSVRDLAGATTLFNALLGAEPYVQESYYVGYRVGGQEIGLDPNGHSNGVAGPIGYVEVDDIEKRLRSLLDAGAQLQQGVKDVGGGKLVASVKDADGNVVGIMQPPA